MTRGVGRQKGAMALVLAFTGVVLTSTCGGGTRGGGTDGDASAAPTAPAPGPTPPSVPAGTPVSVVVLFKLDPLVRGGGTYGGDIWLSQPTSSFSHTGRTAFVDARAEGRDASGRAVVIDPTWVAADPRLVSIAPRQGPSVRITVLGTGETRVVVDAAGVSKILTVKAVYQGEATQVVISQHP